MPRLSPVTRTVCGQPEKARETATSETGNTALGFDEERGCQRLRAVGGLRSWKKQRKDSSLVPANTSVPGGLWHTSYVLFLGIEFAVICYKSNRKLMSYLPTASSKN